MNKNFEIEAFPTIIHIEPTNRCNLQCEMCGRTIKNAVGRKDISLTLYKKIIDQAIDLKVELLILHNWGEPLLHPHIVEMIKYASQKGLPVWMSTNATLLNEKTSKRILKSGLKGMVFSVDGASPETYENIRRGAIYERTVENIRRFIELKRINNVKMMNTIQMIKTEKNAHEADNFIKIWSKYDINVMVKPMVDWRKVDSDPTRSNNFVCGKPWLLMKIHSSGAVVPCGHDANEKHIFGNVNTNRLKEIWNSSEAQLFRKIMLEDWKKHDICLTCQYKSPRRRNFISNSTFVCFDAFCLTQLLFTLGYERDQ